MSQALAGLNNLNVGPGTSRENVPSSRADLSMTGICEAIPCVLTSQSRLGAAQ